MDRKNAPAITAATGICACSCRTSDVVAHIGAQAFLILLPETTLAGALEAGDKLRCHVGASAPSSDHGDCQRRMPDTLYLAKGSGRNRIVATMEEACA